MNLVKIASFRTRLEAHDIPCLIKADDCGGMYVDFGGGAHVLVPEERLDEVRVLLSCIVKGESAADTAT